MTEPHALPDRPARPLRDLCCNLFAGLRYFDDRPEIKSIYVEGFDQGEESLAYMNRLNKAAGGHHV